MCERFVSEVQVNLQVGVWFVCLFVCSVGDGSMEQTTFKQLSEIAHSRRGHDKTYFRQRWSMEVAMCLARRGAQGALRRANTFRSANSEALDDGVLGGVGSEQPLVASAGGG